MTRENAVVIPSFNRPERLRGCLEALVADPAANFRIIVVDDGSPEPLAQVCAAFGDRVSCVRQQNRGPAAARNAGVRASNAAFVAFTDDDCRPRAGWLEALKSAHGGHADRLVGGRVVNALSSNTFSAASQSLCDHLYDYYDAGGGDALFFTSNNLACARERFEALGGFDESFPLAAAEDRDFGSRWREAGGTLVFAPEAVVDHAHDLDLGSFWRQHRNYGRGARHLHRRMDARGSGRPRLETLRFYTGILSRPVRDHGARGIPQSLLLALSQIAMTAGYLSERRREDRS